MLKKEEILQFIQEDISSKKKLSARIGERYYEGEHDIRNYELYYYNADGILVKDENRSNIKISHPFFTELVDQKAQYMLSGKDGFVFSDIPELQDELNSYFNENEDFLSETLDLIVDASSKGFGYMYAYKNKEDKLAFQCADSMGVIEVRAKDTDDNCEYVIYWYIDRIEKNTKEIRRVEVWTDKEVYYFVQDDTGELLEDQDQEVNPRPHVIYTKGNSAQEYFEGFGFIPFFRLDNNRKQISDLKAVKDLIDDYDLMSCGLSNNLQDASEYLVVVRGFSGDNLDELMQNIKTKKHIGVNGDDGGDVDYKTVDIPYQARQAKLTLDETNIYRFGMGFNSNQVGDGNITNIVIKSRYALLDLKCNKLEIRLKQFLRKILKVVLDEINTINGTDYQQKDVYFKFDREVITNESDNATIEKTHAERKQIEINTLLGLRDVIDDETIIQSICETLDINYEDIKNKLPKPEEDEIDNVMNDLNDVPDTGGGVIE